MKYNKLLKLIVLSFLLLFSVFPIKSQTLTQIEINKKYFSELKKIDNIKKIKKLNSLKDKIIIGKGKVEKVESSDIIKRKYKIKINIDNDYSNVVVYCYTDNEDYFDLLQEGDLYQFKGQCINVTIIDFQFKKIIIDILLEDGAVLIK